MGVGGWVLVWGGCGCVWGVCGGGCVCGVCVYVGGYGCVGECGCGCGWVGVGVYVRGMGGCVKHLHHHSPWQLSLENSDDSQMIGSLQRTRHTI